MPNDSAADPCFSVRRPGGNFKIDKISPCDMINQKGREDILWQHIFVKFGATPATAGNTP